jgi:hypothetical protein
MFGAIIALNVRIIPNKQKHCVGKIAGLSYKFTAVGTARL